MSQKLKYQQVDMSENCIEKWGPLLLVMIIIGVNYFFQQFIYIMKMFELLLSYLSIHRILLNTEDQSFLYKQEYKFGGLFATVFLNVNVLFMLANYYQCICTPPGSISPDINDCYPDLEQIKQRSAKEQEVKTHLRKDKNIKQKLSRLKYDNMSIELRNQKEQLKNDILNFDIIKSIQQVSYCIKCERIKLPRTHHCKECKKCIQRMDHHCPWVANCVGVYNHKYFILFLFHATMSVGTCWVNITIDLLFNEESQRLCITVNQVMTFGLTLCIGFLFVFQFNRMINNQTTVEYHIEEIDQRNPFNKGTISNVNELLGENKLFWFCPINPSVSNKENNFQYSKFDEENQRQHENSKDEYY